MQFATLIAAVSALAMGTSAAAIPSASTGDFVRLAQFRIFGAQGCSAKNMGFYTVDDTDVGNCNKLIDSPTSVHLEVLNQPAAQGCTVNVYTDAKCSAGQTALSIDSCSNANATESFQSWKITCPTASA